MVETISPLAAWFATQGAEFLEQEGRRQVLRVRGAGEEYQAGREGLMLADGSDRAVIRLDGADALDFLQRLTSNDLRTLALGAMQWSAMLDGKGHCLADLLIFRLTDGADGHPRLLLDLPSSCLETVLQRLEMNHFGEQLSWQALELTPLLLLGPKAAGPTEDAVAEQGEGYWLRRPDRGTPCWEWLAPAEAATALAQELLAAGAVPGGLVALDILRVEAWQARFGTDFDQDTILPALNEWQRVSLTKGCYVGQEVVARVHTYGESPRQLVRLHVDGPPLPLHGATLQLDGRKLGQVTSWVWSPLQDQGIGLAMVRRQAAVEGQVLTAVTADGQEASVHVSLPPRETSS